eukprot:TRINITY_DN1252_c0_g1_i14.p1 TRINITY_DN1252_c0_g1~~TRINITY_DN1252_c0_g1_i14.p1  ORF type:complete len:173 (-),score=60.03 TRINITY_DN1252_c0_g1_i14:53-571(-)
MKEEEEDKEITARLQTEKAEEEMRRKEEEELERLRKEREKKEEEEYQAIKHQFSVESTGSLMDELHEFESKLHIFIDYIKKSKVVYLEDLAAKFHIKTQAAVDKILSLEKEGLLSGIIDERGKFIYISSEEMLSVSKFIKQRGRVNIHHIQAHSNVLINLVPQSVQDEQEET